MKISEFLVGRNAERQAINRYITRHEEFKGHYKKVGKEIDFDDFAFELLDKQYPLPQPIQIIEDTESRAKLIQAQELIIQLQQQLNLKEQQIGELKQSALLLEYKTQENEELKRTNKELLEQNTKLQSRSWIDVLFKRQ